jgi:hypothetical protein
MNNNFTDEQKFKKRIKQRSKYNLNQNNYEMKKERHDKMKNETHDEIKNETQDEIKNEINNEIIMNDKNKYIDNNELKFILIKNSHAIVHVNNEYFEIIFKKLYYKFLLIKNEYMKGHDGNVMMIFPEIESKVNESNIESNDELDKKNDMFDDILSNGSKIYNKMSNFVDEQVKLLVDNKDKSTNDEFRNMAGIIVEFIFYNNLCDIYQRKVTSQHQNKINNNGYEYLGQMKKITINNHNYYKYYGFGVIEYEDKCYYLGNFVDGSYSNMGYLYIENGKFIYNEHEYNKYIYAGNFHEGKFSGQGQLIIFVNDIGHIIEIDGIFEMGVLAKGKVKYNVEEKYEYDGSFNKYKFHGNGKLIKDDEIYDGIFNYGVYHNYGILEKKDKFNYKGYFNNGKFNGKGVLKYNNSDEYNGEFENNLYHGYGILISGNLTERILYEGIFEQGQYHGKGKLYKKNIIVNDCEEYDVKDTFILIYEGYFKNNLYSGEGILYHLNGYTKYEGNFEDGEYSLNGTLYNENKSIIYRGAFKHGKYNGKGNLFVFDENNELNELNEPTEEYLGEFLNGKKNGSGMLKYKNFEYKGEFFNGFYSGMGFLKKFNDDSDIIEISDGIFSNSYLINGEKKYFMENCNILYEKGKFIRDILVEGEICYNDSSLINKCTVKLNDNERIFSEIFLKNKKYYIGNFKDDDSITGTGTIIFPDNITQYKGEIMNGSMHGKGKIIKGDNVCEGEFENDQIIIKNLQASNTKAIENNDDITDNNNDPISPINSERESNEQDDKRSENSSNQSTSYKNKKKKKSFFSMLFGCCGSESCYVREEPKGDLSSV